MLCCVNSSFSEISPLVFFKLVNVMTREINSRTQVRAIKINIFYYRKFIMSLHLFVKDAVQVFESTGQLQCLVGNFEV